MTTWHDLARDNQQAASVLFREAKYRSTISRAYFAVYARAAHALSAMPVNMPQGRQGPTHKKLRPMIEANLTTVQPKNRKMLSNVIGELYFLRLRADYVPSDDVNLKQARYALTLMRKAFSLV